MPTTSYYPQTLEQWPFPYFKVLNIWETHHRCKGAKTVPDLLIPSPLALRLKHGKCYLSMLSDPESTLCALQVQ